MDRPLRRNIRLIGVIDYGLGNHRSILRMLERLGIQSFISGDPRRLSTATQLILPGVGHFAVGMKNLIKSGLVDMLDDRVNGKKTPLLGICLGAQLLGKYSEEGDSAGLGWLDFTVVGFDRSRLGSNDRVPNMGWAETHIGAHPIFSSHLEMPRFYYVHSYHMMCCEKSIEICTSFHGYQFTSGVAKANVIGVQFHPEKSHTYGMQLLKSFHDMVKHN